ncbi:putative cutinase [Mycobacterium talmoniae]|uniref:Putative cutinase n=1 Tax=Mycobacterium talmoniae TaxID=1858794 RepID=A0A2S8BGK1_9MYCO|nr:putative cutinase [Mycobacterium talmoniae]
MRIIGTKRSRRAARVLGVAVVTVAALLCAPVAASAAGCPDVEVVFARGTFEPPGVGATGQQFIDALGSQIGGRSLDVYPVNYPASTDFPTAADGVIDASNHVRATAANCPTTKMVLGGYSQGAAVIGYVTAAKVPSGYTLPAGLAGPMPLDVANHVAAVALLGKPSNAFLESVDAPPIVIGPRYAGKTIDLCADGDPVCSTGNDNGAHTLYASNGMAAQAAGFAAHHL